MLFSDFVNPSERDAASLPRRIVTDIVSFANTDGGEVIIPYSEAMPALREKHEFRLDCSAAGELEAADPEQMSDRAACFYMNECVIQEIVPDISGYIRARLEKNSEGAVFRIEVMPAPDRPYFIKEASMTPSGVFVRRGECAVAADENLIRRMLAESQEGLSYEDARSPVQDLDLEQDFTGLENAVRDITQKMPDLRKLAGQGDLLSHQGTFTGLGLLLSDRCPFQMVIAVYSGHQLVKKKEIFGSVISQIRQTYSYISEQIADKEKDGIRQRYRMDCVREALLNAAIHRDYAMKGNTVISITDSEIRIVSLGGPGEGLGAEDVLNGAVQCRNPKMARLFFRLGLVRNCGSGMKKFVRPGGFVVPRSYVSVKGAEHSFSVTLRNLDTLRRRIDGDDDGETETDPTDLQKDMANLLQFVLKNGTASRKDIEDEFGFGTTKSFNLLKQLCREGKIVQIRKGIRTTYAAADNFEFESGSDSGRNRHEENGAADEGGQETSRGTDCQDGGADG